MRIFPTSDEPHHVFRGALVGSVVALGVFELLLRVVGLRQDVTAIILGVAMIPALVVGFIRQVGALLSDPDRLPHTIGYAFGTIALTILFFAFLYRELGIVRPSDPAAGEVTSFFTCLYFSASTITTAGLGDFVPMPEARIMAALEMVIGYVAFGIVTAASFFLISHRSRKP
ncbi:potassium channel family protein [Longimicrobium sp.]|uniref:potassium channel family protein n=1 Tax=Longimicrobium sp. TaxID=2029185 RepID=UPI002C6C572A|nr:potassium channel family protein [Longimicrobium sp.]HSU17333.1 potassium channel family protein [Longimicrobium sp.]